MAKKSVGIDLDITPADYVYMDFEYDREVKDDLKESIPGRQFVDTKNRPKQWKFKLDRGSMKPFLRFCKRWDVDIPTPIRSRMQDIVEEMREHEKQKRANDEIMAKDEGDLVDVRGLARGLSLRPFQRRAVEFVEANKRVLIGDQQGLGKAQPVSEPVLTPEGWRAIGDVSTGDFVFGSDGRPTKVTGVYPQGEMDVYEIMFSDGATAYATENHLWCVMTSSQRYEGKSVVVKETRDLAGDLRTSQGYNRWSVPIVEPIQYEERDLLIHPYVMGILLGDGCVFSSGDEWIPHHISGLLPEGVRVNPHADPITYGLVTEPRSAPNPVLDAIKKMGLRGLHGNDKFIPEPYMRASVKQRVALLQGLMDAGGDVSKCGMSCEFSSSSENLARSFAELVESLGGLAPVSSRIPRCAAADGSKREGSLTYRVRPRFHHGINPFRLPRKRDRYKQDQTRGVVRTIDSIQRVRSEECVCISVEADNSLYVTRGHVLTHNTIEAIASVHHLDAYPCLVVCPASLKYNWENEWNAWVPRKTTKVQAAGRDLDLRCRVAIINYDILWKHREELRERGFASLVLDESHFCFPYETEVITDEGPLPIGRVVEEGAGSEVLSWDTRARKTVWRSVQRRFKNPLNRRMARVVLKDGAPVECTVNHKLWSETRSAWVRAADLNEGEELLSLSGRVHAESGEPEILLGEVPREQRVELEDGEAVRALLSDVRDAQEGQEDRALLRPKLRVVEQVSGPGEAQEGRETSRTPEPLRGGHRVPREEAGDRGGRKLAQNGEVALPGRQEGADAHRVRVDRVEVLKRGGDGRHAEVRGQGDGVYDLEVEGTHCYFAGGVLAHNCKNADSQRSKAARQIAKRVAEDSPVLLLSGTPVTNRPADLIHQLKILGAFKREFGSYYAFTKRFCDGKKTRWGWDASGASNLEELHERLRRTCYIRRNKEDVLPELPAKQRQYLEVEITNRAEYRRAEKDIVAWVQKRAVEDEGFLESIEGLDEHLQAARKRRRAKQAGRSAAMAERLMKIMHLKRLAARGKMRATRDWIDDFLASDSGPLLVFAWHRDIVNEIADHYDAPRIMGDVSAEDRQRIVEEFQRGEHDMLVMNIQAGGVGLTLTRSSSVLFVEMPWTWAEVEQAEDRAHRMGQEGSVNVCFVLARDTIDRDVFDALEYKRVIAEQVNAGRNIVDEDGNVVRGVIRRMAERAGS